MVRVSLAAGRDAVLEGLDRLADQVHAWHDAPAAVGPAAAVPTTV